MSVDALDTNVFVYLFDRSDHRKREMAEKLVAAAMETRNASVSYQVIQEAVSVIAARTLPGGHAAARKLLLEVLIPLWKVMPSAGLYERALSLRARYQLHFYDALVVAAALEAGCDRLLTEDLQHGQVIEGLRIENPFLQ